MKNHNLHIVIYSELLEYGGGRETWLEYFLRGLIKEDYFHQIWVHHLSPRLRTDSLCSTIEHICFNEINIGLPENNSSILNMFKFTRFIISSLKNYTQKGDIVLFVGTGMESISAIATRVLLGGNIKILIWVRSIISGELMSRKSLIASRIAQKLEYWAFKSADKVIFNGQDTREYYDNQYSDEADKYVTIVNAVKFDDFAILDIPDFGETPYVIGYIGRFSREKGFDNLIDAANIIKELDRQYPIEIQVWGHGIDFNTLPPNIINHGSVARDKVPQALSSCHVALFLNKCAKHEAGGLSHGLLEALAAGRLIIAWENAGHGQVLDDSNALLVPEGDIEQLANMFTELCESDVEELIRKCKNARVTAKNYTVEAHLNKFLQLVSTL